MLMKMAMLIIRLESWTGLWLKTTVFVRTGILIHLFAVIHQVNLLKRFALYIVGKLMYL